MVSLKKLLYIVGTVTGNDDNKYMSFREMCSYFDEGCDYKHLLSRVRSQVNSHENLFAIKRVGKRNVLWRLNANGKKYLDKFINSFDPVADIDLNPSKNQVFRPKRAEVI